jgi:hypothetical protein
VRDVEGGRVEEEFERSLLAVQTQRKCSAHDLGNDDREGRSEEEPERDREFTQSEGVRLTPDMDMDDEDLRCRKHQGQRGQGEPPRPASGGVPVLRSGQPENPESRTDPQTRGEQRNEWNAAQGAV